MRTTLTLDEDVAAKLKALARRAGKPFRDIVNETLRRGLLHAAPRGSTRFTVAPRDLGARRTVSGFDNLGQLLEEVEGPLHR